MAAAAGWKCCAVAVRRRTAVWVADFDSGVDILRAIGARAAWTVGVRREVASERERMRLAAMVRV